MDIAKFQLGGEWLELKIKGGKLNLNVMVKPLSDKEQLEMAGTAKKEDMIKFLDEIKGLVLDWDLTEGKEPLRCNEVNKKKYLPYLVNMTLEKEKVEGEDDEDSGKTVGLAILEFAQNFNNFIKN